MAKFLTPEEKEIMMKGAQAAGRKNPEILSNAIVRISTALESLSKNSRLNRDAIIVLVHDRTGIAKRTIEAILGTMEDLRRQFVLPDKRKGLNS